MHPLPRHQSEGRILRPLHDVQRNDVAVETAGHNQCRIQHLLIAFASTQRDEYGFNAHTVTSKLASAGALEKPLHVTLVIDVNAVCRRHSR